jgi:hypothetical protein
VTAHLNNEAMRALGVSRQTVLQRVKRGELEACHVTKGKQKGLRMEQRAGTKGNAGQQSYRQRTTDDAGPLIIQRKNS